MCESFALQNTWTVFNLGSRPPRWNLWKITCAQVKHQPGWLVDGWLVARSRTSIYLNNFGKKTIRFQRKYQASLFSLTSMFIHSKRMCIMLTFKTKRLLYFLRTFSVRAASVIWITIPTFGWLASVTKC